MVPLRKETSFDNQAPIELRKTALVHALDFVRNHRPPQPSADDVVETAATFERYLRGETVSSKSSQ